MYDFDWSKAQPVFPEQRVSNWTDKEIKWFPNKVAVSIDLQNHFTSIPVKCEFYLFSVRKFVFTHFEIVWNKAIGRLDRKERIVGAV
jgi:uncharacterized membrane protein YfbV (UPF0208 family)